ncbi:MAG: O-antigen ligase family protein [Aurantimicrobium sp.]|uniref:O-antigen ligase family protein n=1 Tax=Aurantimicrobium sp. TaxID=1930784 RepID=UPI002FC8BC49
MLKTFFPIISLTFTFLIIGPIAPWSSDLTLFERALIALIFFAVSVATSKEYPRVIALSTPLILLLVTATLSLNEFFLFSIFKDWLSFLIIAGIAMFAAWTYSLEKIVFSLALAGALLALYTVYLFFTSPSTAIDEAGLLMGAFTGKNNLALTLMFTVPAILTTQLMKNLWIRVITKSALILFMAVLILSTKSASSIVTFVLTVVCFGAFLLVKKYRRSLPWVIGSALAMGLLVVLNFTTILGLFSKGSDLTGRIPLWTASMHAMEGKWLTGYGWSSLFGYESPAALFIQNELGQFFLHSHNELIYWFVMTGIFGAIFLIGTYVSTFALGIKNAVFGDKSLQLWVPLAVLALAFGGITEISSAYIQGWFILVLAVSALGRYLADIPAKSRIASWVLFLEWETRTGKSSSAAQQQAL